MSFEIKGLKHMERQLKSLAAKAGALDGLNEVRFDEVFTDAFVSASSRFGSISELIKTSGFHVESQKDFDAIPEEPWDKFIRGNTSFSSWQEMKESAAASWARRKLGL